MSVNGCCEHPQPRSDAYGVRKTMPKSISKNQKWTLTGHGYLVRNVKGVVVYQHREIAEQILGRKLKNRECVHHIDGDRTNNKNNNLVICPNDAYHHLLHKREDALNATGHANWLKCGYCLEYSPPDQIRAYLNKSPRHVHCSKRYYKEWDQRRKLARELAQEN